MYLSRKPPADANHDTTWGWKKMKWGVGGGGGEEGETEMIQWWKCLSVQVLDLQATEAVITAAACMVGCTSQGRDAELFSLHGSSCGVPDSSSLHCNNEHVKLFARRHQCETWKGTNVNTPFHPSWTSRGYQREKKSDHRRRIQKGALTDLIRVRTLTKTLLEAYTKGRS